MGKVIDFKAKPVKSNDNGSTKTFAMYGDDEPYGWPAAFIKIYGQAITQTEKLEAVEEIEVDQDGK